MNLRDFRIGWRLLMQQPAYSAIVTGGLAIGFAACFLLLGYVAYCLDYDSRVPYRERVYVVKQRINLFPRPEWQTNSYLSLRDMALRSGLVSAATIVKDLDLPLRQGGQLHKMSVQAVDPAFATIFGLAAAQGDLQAALTQPDGVALTASAARQLFGAAPPLGQTIQAGAATLQVRALLPDHQANTNQAYEALVGSGSSAWPEAQRNGPFTYRNRGTVYLKLKRGASATALAALLQQAADESPQDRQARAAPVGKSLRGRKVSDVALLPLSQLYFDADLANSRDGANHGRIDSVLGLAAIALLILLLATVNYVNLATVRTLRRQREIAVRKLLGAGAPRLIRQFLGESALTAVLSAGAGLLLAWLLLPLFSELVRRPLDGVFTPARCAAALLLALAVGLCAGAYPAWCAQRVRPGPALAGRGNSETVGGLWLRRALTVLQFGAAIALSAATLAVGWQAWYAGHAWPGFDPRQILTLDLPVDAGGTPAAQAFADALALQPRIGGVASMSEAVGRDGWKIVGSITTRDRRDIRMEIKYVGAGWFQLYGLQPLWGRLFDPALDHGKSSNVVLNAAAATALGFASPRQAVGQTMPNGDSIVGIAPEVRFQTLRQPSEALLYQLKPGGVLTFRSADDAATVYRDIEPLWRRYFPDEILEVHTAQSLLTAMYDDDLRLSRMLALASAVAIALAAFGIYVLSAYSVQRSAREIVIRKLHGARGVDIAALVGGEFALLVGAGAVLGLPPAALAIQRYLAGFVEHAPVGGWTLAAALTLAALVATLATARHTLTALRLPPALALRD